MRWSLVLQGASVLAHLMMLKQPIHMHRKKFCTEEQITFELEVQLHFPTLFCSAAPALRCKSRCRLYIVVCFVQRGIVLINMCVDVFHIYVYIVFTLAKISGVTFVTVQSSVKIFKRYHEPASNNVGLAS